MSAKNRREDLRRNRLRLRWMNICGCSMSGVIPTLPLLWERNGMSIADGMMQQCIFAASYALFDLPTGYLADRLGRTLTLRVSAVMRVLGALSFCLATGYWGFLCGEMCFGFGLALASGCDEALLCDGYLELGCRNSDPTRKRESHAFSAAIGSVRYAGFYSMAVYAVVGGLLGSYNPRLPVVISLVAVLVGMFPAMQLVEARHGAEKLTHGALREVAETAKHCFTRTPRLLWLTLFPALVFAFNQPAVWMYDGYFKLIGLPTEIFGLMFAFFHIVAGEGSKHAKKLAESADEKILIIAPLAASVIGYQLMSGFPFLFSWLFIFLQQWTRGFMSNAFVSRTNALLPSKTRATAAALRNIVNLATYAVVLVPCLSGVTEFGILRVFQGLSLGLAVLAGFLIWFCYSDDAPQSLEELERESETA